jgi:peptide/nickel transport system permease protein
VIRYIVRRLLGACLVVVGVSVATFLLVHLTGDPTALYIGTEYRQEDYEILRHAMGFDRPLQEQYWRFFSGAIRGDFGLSLRHQVPSLPLVLEKLPATIQLAMAAMAFAVAIALPLGIFSALKKDSILDTVCMVAALSGQCIPTFWLGIMLIVIFAVQLHLLPAYGRADWRSLILPSLTLGAWAMARTARLTRSSMLEVLSQDYLRTARAKGLIERVVILRHALKNAAIPIVTAISLDLGNLLSGAIITEAVFAYPGIGRLVVEAVINKDIPMIQAIVFVIGAMFVLVNLVTDIFYVVLDPRIRLG